MNPKNSHCLRWLCLSILLSSLSLFANPCRATLPCSASHQDPDQALLLATKVKDLPEMNVIRPELKRFFVDTDFTVRELRDLTYRQLLKLPGLGPIGARKIEILLASYSLSLKPDPSAPPNTRIEARRPPDDLDQLREMQFQQLPEFLLLPDVSQTLLSKNFNKLGQILDLAPEQLLKWRGLGRSNRQSIWNFLKLLGTNYRSLRFSRIFENENFSEGPAVLQISPADTPVSNRPPPDVVAKLNLKLDTLRFSVEVESLIAWRNLEYVGDLFVDRPPEKHFQEVSEKLEALGLQFRNSYQGWRRPTPRR